MRLKKRTRCGAAALKEGGVSGCCLHSNNDNECCKPAMYYPPLSVENGPNGRGRAYTEWPPQDSMMADDWSVSSTMSTTSQQAELMHVRRAMEENTRSLEAKLRKLRMLEEANHRKAQNTREKCLSMAVIRREAANFAKTLAHKDDDM